MRTLSSDSMFLACLLFAGVVGLVIGVSALVHKPSCTDYSFKISRMPFNRKVAICDQWPRMDMVVSRTLIGGTIVNCTCPETSPK